MVLARHPPDFLLQSHAELWDGRGIAMSCSGIPAVGNSLGLRWQHMRTYLSTYVRTYVVHAPPRQARRPPRARTRTHVRTYVRTSVRTYASEEEDEGEDHAPSGGAALVSAPTDAAAHLADSLSCAAANANAANGNHGSF